MDLEVQTLTTVDDDHSWLKDTWGRETMETIQLDGSAFTGTYADGRIPSGTPLGLLSGGGGLYGLYDNTDPAAFAGFLGDSVQVINKAGATHDVVANLQRDAHVIEANLPASWTGLGSTPKSAGKTDVGTRVAWY